MSTRTKYIWPMQHRWMTIGWFACLVASSSLHSQEPTSPSKNLVPPQLQGTNFPIKTVGDGIYEIGIVRLDKNRGSVSFPGAINMNEGLVEYWLVSAGGKLHESLLRTEAEPYQIHLAMLLVGAQGTGTNTVTALDNSKPAPPSSAFFSKTNAPVAGESAKLILGDKISLSVNWKGSDGMVSRQAEETVLNLQTKSVMTRGNWIYNGSRVLEGNFIAQRDRSIVSIISDPDALVNNPRPGRENDEIWQINSTNLPPVGTVVQVTIKLENNAGKL